ncbi:hypothetical protein HG471_000120 [Candidatus Saccharibacteria bacterium]|nr:hypothetical protein [Candidatus Saccharibacteria bacterium]
MKDNDKNKRKELAAKQKFHEDMVLGSKFIQNWYLFPTVPADGVEYAYDEFLRSVALFLHRRTMALEIQDLGISLFGASRYPCFDNILELGQPGFYGVIDNVARIEKLTIEENKAFVGKMRKQHPIYKVKKSELVYKIAAASGEFYVGLSAVNPSFALLLNKKIEQNKKANSVLDNLNLNRMILEREIFSAMNFMDDYGDMRGYYDGGEDDFSEDDEDLERPDGEVNDKPDNLGRSNIDGQKPTTLEMDDSKKKDIGSDGSKKNDKPKGKPKGGSKDGKKRKKKP